MLAKWAEKGSLITSTEINNRILPFALRQNLFRRHDGAIFRRAAASE